jgi:hypothetical protein
MLLDVQAQNPTGWLTPELHVDHLAPVRTDDRLGHAQERVSLDSV